MNPLFAGIVGWRQRTQWHEIVLGMVGVLLSGLLVAIAVGQELVSRQAGASQLEEPQVATWKPWVLTSASQFRPPPPPGGLGNQSRAQSVASVGEGAR